MKLHLHIVDGNAPLDMAGETSSASGAVLPQEQQQPLAVRPNDDGATTVQSSAALFFAHLTLRCGHLNEIVVVSASTTPALERHSRLLPQPATATSAAGATATAGATRLADGEPLVVSAETEVLQTAARVLRGDVAAAAAGDGGGVELPFLNRGGESVEAAAIVSYSFFDTPFPVAEQQLRRAVGAAASGRDGISAPPYFDLIAAVDMETFEYLTDYYRQLRLRGGDGIGGRRLEAERPVGLLYASAEDPARAAVVLQRIVEMLLQRSGYVFGEAAVAADEEAVSPYYSNLDTAETAAPPSSSLPPRVREGEWCNHVDEAAALFGQLLGVDVLVAVV